MHYTIVKIIIILLIDSSYVCNPVLFCHPDFQFIACTKAYLCTYCMLFNIDFVNE